MEVISELQGSDAWHAIRAKHFTASEAAAAQGLSKYQTRNELLKQKATGIVEDNSGKAHIFAKGHEAEAAARPIVESILGEDLFPCVGTAEVDGLPLLASFDGITLGEDIVWENKLMNTGLLEYVKDGDLEPHYWLQIEQQLLVSQAEKCYFTVSDGTPENTYGFMYKSIPERRAQLISGWKQFQKDLANYQHVEVLPAPVAKPAERLPALVVNLVGEVTRSNLSAYKAAAVAVISNINTELATDGDFAQAESDIKFCDAGERELELVKSQALAQTATIEDLFRTIDDLKEHLRAKRLNLEKLVKARKDSIRLEIVAQAKSKYAQHIADINAWLPDVALPIAYPDFAAAIKGKRTIASLHEACDTLLANAKIEADATAARVAANLDHLFNVDAPKFLFSDLPTIALKSSEDFAALVRDRMATHAEQEAARVATETARIAEQERIKAEAKVRADVAAEEQRHKNEAYLADAEAREAARQAEMAGAVLAVRGVAADQSGAPVASQVMTNQPKQPVSMSDIPVLQIVRQRASTRSLVDNLINGLTDPQLQQVLSYLQANFVKQAA